MIPDGLYASGVQFIEGVRACMLRIERCSALQNPQRCDCSFSEGDQTEMHY